MALETSGEVGVDVDRETAFAFVRDFPRLAESIPGCRDLRETGPGRYEAVLSAKVAFMTVSFKVAAEVRRVEPPHLVEATIAGNALGMAGRVSAAASLRLDSVDATHTVIHYQADVTITGKLGGLGQVVMRARSHELAREFASNLKAAIERGVETPAP